MQAQKFQCLLVSRDPADYMMGLVPFEFKDRQAAQNTVALCHDGSVWDLTKHAFDSRSRPEFIGCPMKAVVLLSKPTEVKPVLSANTLAMAYPARGLHVALTITGIMDALKQATGNAIAGCNRTFDFAG